MRRLEKIMVHELISILNDNKETQEFTKKTCSEWRAWSILYFFDFQLDGRFFLQNFV